jgi:UDP-N-acetylglucosamine 2-epimerase (non-hydrolysing)
LENLKREGIADCKVHFVGNVMIDTLLRHRDAAAQSDIAGRLGLRPGARYVLVTLHRPSNVDDREKLRGLLRALDELARDIAVIFPIHPRTRRNAEEAGLDAELGRLVVTEPLGYLEFLNLMNNAQLVITDSGGVQEETTVLGVPCLTVRENTERPATVEFGTNRLVGADPRALLPAAREILGGRRPAGRLPELWDGRAAERIVAVVQRFLGIAPAH